MQMPYMLLCCFVENDHVINVTPRKEQTKEDLVHHYLKLNRHIFEAKWKKLPLVRLIFPIIINSPKCGFHSISRNASW